jgi:hypothetical protein
MLKEATSAIELLATKCKGTAHIMNSPNNAALQKLEKLRNENKLLKGKLDHALGRKMNQWH